MALRLVWLWFWYVFGSATYMLKRGFYLVTGPNPIANDAMGLVKVAGIAMLFRFIVESCIFWALFTPQLAAAILAGMGWQRSAAVVTGITQFAPASLAFGLLFDFAADWFIATVISKVTFLNLKDWWPQMPGPMLPPNSLTVKETVKTQTVEVTATGPNNPSEGK